MIDRDVQALNDEIDAKDAAIDAKDAEIAALKEALEPFAAVGRLIDGPFGPRPRADDNASCGLGCAWTENGERKTLAWSAFRRAALEMSGGVK